MKPLLLVDGYNVIGAWSVPREEHLSIEQARERLVHLIADYAGYSGEEVIVVFDGHYTDRPTRSRTMMHGVEVVGGIPRRGVICRRAAGQTGGEQDGSDQNSQLFHSAQGYCLR